MLIREEELCVYDEVFALYMSLFIFVVFFGWEAMAPSPTLPSAVSAMNWLNQSTSAFFDALAPLFLLYNFSADACTINTVYRRTKLVMMALA